MIAGQSAQLSCLLPLQPDLTDTCLQAYGDVFHLCTRPAPATAEAESDIQALQLPVMEFSGRGGWVMWR